MSNFFPPSLRVISGVPTDIIGVVGAAPYGPKNSYVMGASFDDFLRSFGALINRTYDLGTATALAILQGAQAFRWVRVTDGTDAAATADLMDTAATPAEGALLTAMYTGSTGNGFTAAITAGSVSGTYTLTISRPGYPSEVFANIAGTGSAFWQNLVNAVNQGQSLLRGPSATVIASLPATQSTSAPNTTSTYTLAGGLDGATGLTDNSLVGSDGLAGARTGMYALRGSKASIGVLADVSTPATFSLQAAFGQSEGVYMIAVGAPGQTTQSGITAFGTANIQSWALKVLLGDWLYWFDPANNVQRVVSPQGFVAGLLANMGPQGSSLNKELFGIITSQSQVAGIQYGNEDYVALTQAGMDVIATPSWGGNYWSCQTGLNTSNNGATNGDNYSRMTIFISQTLNAGMGWVVGRTNTTTLDQESLLAINTMLDTLQGLQQIKNYQTAITTTASESGAGMFILSVTVQYLAIIEKFIINYMGGQTVQIQRVSTTQVAA